MNPTPEPIYGSGQSAGVLVLHAWWGLNDFFKDLCQRLADAGFAALAPDLYHGQVAATIDQAKYLRSKMNRKQAGAEILAAASRLQAITARPIGVIGFSLGAYLALGLAVERPASIKAVTVFYGTRQIDYSPSQAAFQGHFAERDEWESALSVKNLEKRLRKAGRPVEFYNYPDAGHWFFESDRPEAYQPQAAALAWDRTVNFLRQQLNG
jgi:carboxymethylenebutenolidase